MNFTETDIQRLADAIERRRLETTPVRDYIKWLASLPMSEAKKVQRERLRGEG